jgi:uncharacterized protein (DUF1015 family)
MAVIKPFKAIRPAKDKVGFVASRSYQEYSRRELNAVLDYNPFSFLHIINPGYKYAKNVTGKERFKLVHNRYLEFLEDHVFIKDEKDALYLYQMQKGKTTFTGLFCVTSVKDYQENRIKKHENTIQRREELFANYLEMVSFNAEPVLMTYADNDYISEILQQEMLSSPEYLFTTRDKITHKLWVISNDTTVRALQNAFEAIDALYIADGHHRSASSNLLARNAKKNNANHTGQEPYNYFMSYLIPESEIRIYEFHRTIKDLNGLDKEEFLIRLDEFYSIENKGTVLYKPSKKYHFSMYLDGEFYSLYLRKKVYVFTDALSKLDTQILYKTILEPILSIKDLRKDKRIQYGYGKHNVIQMKDDIDKGKFAVGFSLVPATISELKTIADDSLVMPPKSTYIEPKLRSGLAIYEL